MSQSFLPPPDETPEDPTNPKPKGPVWGDNPTDTGTPWYPPPTPSYTPAWGDNPKGDIPTYSPTPAWSDHPTYPATPAQSDKPTYPATPTSRGASAAAVAPAGMAQSTASPDTYPANVFQGSTGNTGIINPDFYQGTPASSSQGTFDRNRFRDDLMSQVHNTTDLANFVNAHQNDYGAGVRLLPGGKGDKIVLPDGAIIDAVMAAGENGGRGSAWTGAGTMGPNGTITAPPPPPGAPQGVGGPPPGAPGNFQDQIRAQLLEILKNSQQPVDANDPQIKAQMDAAQTQSTRIAQQERASAAERAAANGLLNGGQSSGGFDTELRGIQENQGQQLQGLQAQLFTRAIQAKQSQLQQELSLAVQSGDAESARAIQLQIAQMNAELQRQQLAQQQGIWNDQYGLQKAIYEQNQNNNSLGSLL